MAQLQILTTSRILLMSRNSLSPSTIHLRSINSLLSHARTARNISTKMYPRNPCGTHISHQVRKLSTKPSPKHPTGAENTFRNRFIFWFQSTRLYRLSKNRWFRAGLRAMRIGVLSITLYQLGRTSGIHDFVRDPNKHTTEFIMQSLTSMNARAVEICNGGRQTHHIDFESQQSALRVRSEEMKIVRRIGERLVHSAHDHVADVLMLQPISSDEIDSEIKVKVNGRWIKGMLGNKVKDQEHVKNHKDIQYEVRAVGNENSFATERYNIMTEEDERFDESRRILERKWTFLLYESPHPNAFVTGLLPNHVFVATSLLNKKVCGTDDEVAMVMGHELAHTVLDHCHADFDGMVFTSIASTILISLLDPTGFGSFLYEMFGVGMLSTYAYLLPAKRCHENEADSLGLTFVAKACFQPDKAILFFKKLQNMENEMMGLKPATGEDEAEQAMEESSISKSIRGWSSDHPLTEERVAFMEQSVSKAMNDFKLHCSSPNCQVQRSSLLSSFFFQK